MLVLHFSYSRLPMRDKSFCLTRGERGGGKKVEKAKPDNKKDFKT